MHIALLSVALALASEPAAEGAEHKPDVVGVVMEHVTNSRTLEFQVPLVDKKIEFTPPEWKVDVAGHTIDFTITKHVFWMLVLSGLMAILFVGAGRRKTEDEIPTGFAAAIEFLVEEYPRKMAIEAMGEHEAERYVPYLASVFFFVLCSGLLGMIPYTSTPTSNIAVTLSLALCTFVLTQLAGMRSQGAVGYWTHLVPPGVPWVLYPIMLVVEVLGLFTKPFALTVRLFANMNAGHIVILVLLGLVYMVAHPNPALGFITVPAALIVNGLELLIIYVQAVIFTLLSATFIGLVMHGH